MHALRKLPNFYTRIATWHGLHTLLYLSLVLTAPVIRHFVSTKTPKSCPDAAGRVQNQAHTPAYT